MLEAIALIALVVIIAAVIGILAVVYWGLVRQNRNW